MANNLASNKVTVAFPNNKRVQQPTTSRNMTELAFTRATTDIVDKVGWVVSDTLPTNTGDVFEFCIKGYHFTVDGAALNTLITGTLSTPDNVYAYITVDSNSELVGQDDNSLYNGLDFQSSVPSNTSSVTAFLRILIKKTDSSGNITYVVPDESKKKIDARCLDIYIDGGLI